MSTLVTANISDGTTTVGTEYVVNGSAKAWVNFNGTGTVAISASANVASIVDNGTGDYTLNLTNSMANANYAVPAGTAYFNGSNGANDSIAQCWQSTTALFSIACGYVSGSGASKRDQGLLVAVAHGDLA